MVRLLPPYPLPILVVPVQSACPRPSLPVRHFVLSFRPSTHWIVSLFILVLQHRPRRSHRLGLLDAPPIPQSVAFAIRCGSLASLAATSFQVRSLSYISCSLAASAGHRARPRPLLPPHRSSSLKHSPFTPLVPFFLLLALLLFSPLFPVHRALFPSDIAPTRSPGSYPANAPGIVPRHFIVGRPGPPILSVLPSLHSGRSCFHRYSAAFLYLVAAMPQWRIIYPAGGLYIRLPFGLFLPGSAPSPFGCFGHFLSPFG